MESINKTLLNWLNELQEFKFPDYEEFPDIDLYMDQVVTYLERELKVLQTSSLDKVITPSMINNYVKGEVVTAPISKKYNKEHLALINETCSLKQVLSIAEIKQVLDTEYDNESNSDVFNLFKEISSSEFNDAAKNCVSDLSDIEQNDIKSLTKIALSLAISANANITIAKRILFYIRKYNEIKEIRDDAKKEKENKKEKEKEKEKETTKQKND